jgi:peptidoglycan/xylan/chitin deacetylase (PgdA/CDA1 family)
MNARLPAYYSSLAPFSALFQQATPILTYHKLGPRPGRVRLKGLYVSAKLFAAQMAELSAAGFSSGSLLTWNQPPAARQVVITFDDGYVNVLRYGLEALAVARLKAIQFLPADLLGKCNEWDVPLGEAAEPIMTASQVREWISAGHEIGSHSLTHPYLTRLSAARAREEISASRKKLEDLFGVSIQHFCYPYGDWNESVGELVPEAGYKTACTTDPGVNQSGDSPFALKRFTARYPSRSLKTFWSWLFRRSIA